MNIGELEDKLKEVFDNHSTLVSFTTPVMFTVNDMKLELVSVEIAGEESPYLQFTFKPYQPVPIVISQSKHL